MNAAQSVDSLKVKSVFYRAIAASKLTFLLVQDGYRYQLFDVVQLFEIDDVGEETGSYCFVRVMFLIADPALGLREGYAALSIKLEVQSSRFKPSSLTPKPE